MSMFVYKKVKYKFLTDVLPNIVDEETKKVKFLREDKGSVVLPKHCVTENFKRSLQVLHESRSAMLGVTVVEDYLKPTEPVQQGYSSEFLPRGTEIEFTLKLPKQSHFHALLPTLLDCGKTNGIGGGLPRGSYGRFMYKV